jgi:hypothetical protein
MCNVDIHIVLLLAMKESFSLGEKGSLGSWGKDTILRQVRIRM